MKKKFQVTILLSIIILPTYIFCKKDRLITDKKNITISAVGDIMCYMVNIKLAHNKKTDLYDFSHVYREIRPLVQKGDISFGNLETTLPGKDAGYSDYPKFGSPDNLVHTLKWAGFDILNIANNHILDRGESTLLRTIEIIKTKGISPIGVFHSDYNKKPILIQKVNGFKIAFLSYTYSTNGAEKSSAAKINIIKKNKIIHDLAFARKKKPDAIVMYYHFGEEYKRNPNRFQKQMVDLSFYHGADIVLASHPHVIQPFEIQKTTDIKGVTKNRLVAYSLGNFISSQWSPHTDIGIVFHITLKKNKNRSEISGIYFDLVWMLRGYREGRIKDMVLPLEKYIKNDQKYKIPMINYKKMLKYKKLTLKHLKNGISKAKKIGIWKPI